MTLSGDLIVLYEIYCVSTYCRNLMDPDSDTAGSTLSTMAGIFPVRMPCSEAQTLLCMSSFTPGGLLT